MKAKLQDHDLSTTLMDVYIYQYEDLVDEDLSEDAAMMLQQ